MNIHLAEKHFPELIELVNAQALKWFRDHHIADVSDGLDISAESDGKRIIIRILDAPDLGILFEPIKTLQLSARPYNGVKHLKYVGALVRWSEVELSRLGGIGRKSIREIADKLQQQGLILGEDYAVSEAEAANLRSLTRSLYEDKDWTQYNYLFIGKTLTRFIHPDIAHRVNVYDNYIQAR